MLTSLNALSNERLNDRSQAKRNNFERLENARDNAFYIPSITEETSRSLMLNKHRDSQTTAENRFLQGSMARTLKAKNYADTEEKSLEYISKSIWQEAIQDNEDMILLSYFSIRHTYAWYLLQEYNQASNLQKQEKIKVIKKLFNQ